ncbi:MAG: transcriptional repressor LexA [Alphaproteobacteria bacterium]|nr:transcriptional repressor LexA [Alphaproteobacteria bacterium SS10]
MLTRKQAELLKFICTRMDADGVAPSFDEMKVAIGLKSKSGIHRLISALEERGFIRRLPHRARALEILRRPDTMATPAQPAPAVPTIAASTAPANDHPQGAGDALDVPMMGRIAAGTPIEAIRQPDNFVQVPEALIGAKAADIYALEVAGDSMIEAGILDGDTVLIERCDQASNGVIVVALVDGEEVTLKRLRKNGSAVALEPANRDYEIQLFNADQVQVQGRLIGLMRQY